MSCTDTIHDMGWSCAALRDHPDVQYITTPFTLAGGRPLNLYVERRGTRLHLTDDGDTLWALRTVGHPLDDYRQWRPLRSLGEQHHIPLADDGSFACEVDADALRDAAARWAALLSGITAWDTERLAMEDMDQSLEREVEAILALRHDIALEPRARIDVNGTDIYFSFRWGRTLVDAVPLHQAATNARLRKALIVQRSDAQQAMLFVIDDRNGDIDRTDREVALLGNVTRAIALRNLRDFAQRADAPRATA